MQVVGSEIHHQISYRSGSLSVGLENRDDSWKTATCTTNAAGGDAAAATSRRRVYITLVHSIVSG